MKNLLVILTAFLLVLILGCQENMLNEPGGTFLKGDDNFRASNTLTTSNTIKLNYNLSDPLYGPCKLTGSVNYSLEVSNLTMNPLGTNEVILQLHINSTLIDDFGMIHLEWRAEGRSEDVVFVSEEGIVLLDKSYAISNRNDVILLIRYLVTTDGVGIFSATLAQIER